MEEPDYDELVCGSPLHNYYGEVQLFRSRHVGGYYLSLDDYSLGTSAVVTDEFAAAFIKQFADHKATK